MRCGVFSPTHACNVGFEQVLERQREGLVEPAILAHIGAPILMVRPVFAPKLLVVHSQEYATCSH